MLGMEQLKESIELTETTVECPVKGCGEKIERQREVFKREKRFKCPKHNIYISPSTFEYQIELAQLHGQRSKFGPILPAPNFCSL